MNRIGRMLSMVAIAALLPLLLLSDAFAQSAPITAREFVENSILHAHVDELKNGEIVTLTQPEREMANQLNVLMAILVPTALKETVDTLKRQATAEEGPGILAIADITAASGSNPDAAFAGVAFTAEEKAEVAEMMAAAPGNQFNYSLEEIAMIKKRAAGVTDGDAKGDAAIHAMSLAMRDVLKGRYQAYQARGLEGLAPYQEGSSEQIHPSRELISATESLALVRERFPQYYACMRNYPQQRAADVAHQFFWAKQMESGRPLFMLKHWMTLVRSDHAIITERRFYLNHSLDSLQVVIGCLPHRDSTLVVLLNQAFTEKIDVAFGKMIAKQIGYHEVEKNIRPIFENLRAALRR